MNVDLDKAIDPSAQYRPVSAVEIDSQIVGFDYVIENIFIKQYLYTLTGSNNQGKTTLMALMIEAITSGEMFAGNRVIQGNVLILSGENVTDTMLKFRLLPKARLDRINLIPVSFDMKAEIDKVFDLVSKSGVEYVAVFIDSAQAYFGKGDMNGNSEILDHFKAMRRFTELQGSPFVTVLAHPIKTPDNSNLVPYGGGSVMNEIDTNLTLITSNGIATLAIGKKRQPGFADLKFELKAEPIPGLFTNFGIQVTSSRFQHIPYVEAEQIEQTTLDDEERVLMMFDMGQQPTMRQIGKALWPVANDSTSKTRASRILQSLQDLKMVKKSTGGKYELTSTGSKRIKSLIKEKPF